MFDFSADQFNPQPEPPPVALDGLLTAPAGRHTYYQYELKNVLVTSYSMNGA